MDNADFNMYIASDVKYAAQNADAAQKVAGIIRDAMPEMSLGMVREKTDEIMQLARDSCARLDAECRKSPNRLTEYLLQESSDSLRTEYKSLFETLHRFIEDRPGRIVLPEECLRAYENIDTVSDETLFDCFETCAEAAIPYLFASGVRQLAPDVDMTFSDDAPDVRSACAVASALMRKAQGRVPKELENAADSQIADLVVARCRIGDIADAYAGDRISMQDAIPLLFVLALWLAALVAAILCESLTAVCLVLGVFFFLVVCAAMEDDMGYFDNLFPAGFFNTAFGRKLRAFSQSFHTFWNHVFEIVKTKCSFNPSAVEEKTYAELVDLEYDEESLDDECEYGEEFC